MASPFFFYTFKKIRNRPPLKNFLVSSSSSRRLTIFLPIRKEARLKSDSLLAVPYVPLIFNCVRVMLPPFYSTFFLSSDKHLTSLPALLVKWYFPGATGKKRGTRMILMQRPRMNHPPRPLQHTSTEIAPATNFADQSH